MMSVIELVGILCAMALVVLIVQLSRVKSHLTRIATILYSLDAELFRMAQQQDPTYGVCSRCGRRAAVRHVLAKDGTNEVDSDRFYCRPCWWMSDSVQIGDENKHYKDRLTERDAWAATIGPGKE